jgi:hypothetical protein
MNVMKEYAYEEHDVYFYDTHTKIKEPFTNKIRRILTSFTALFICYVLSVIIYHTATAIFCDVFNIHNKFNYNGFTELNSSLVIWNLKRVTAVFSSGFIICIIIFAVILYQYIKKKDEIDILRYYLLIGLVVFLNFTMIQLVVSPIGTITRNLGLYQGLSVVFTWYRFNGLLLVPLLAVALIIMFVFGYKIGNEFLKFSFTSRINANRRNRIYFLIQVYFLPLILLFVTIIPLTREYSIIINFFLFVGLLYTGIGMVVRMEYDRWVERAYKADVLNKIPKVLLPLSVLLWVVIFFFWR